MGIYSIKENYIIIERYKVPAFGESYQTYVDKGFILNEKQYRNLEHLGDILMPKGFFIFR